MAIYNRGTRKKPNYMYRTYVGIDPVTGKDKYISKSGFRTKEDAQFAEVIIKNQYKKGHYIGPDKTKLNELKNAFLLDYKNTGVKPTTIILREKMLNRFVNDMSNIRVQAVTQQEYQQYINDLAKTYSKNSLKAMHTSVKMMFQYAVEETKIIKESPCEKIKLPAFKKTVEELESEHLHEKYLEKEELKEFLAAAKAHGLYNDYPMFTLFAYSGIRAGELRGLKWSDLDVNNHTIRISKTLYNNNKKDLYQLLTPKSNKSERILSIDPVVTTILEQHKTEQDKVKKENDLVYHDKNFIFATVDGYPLSLNRISDRIDRLKGYTGITKHVSTHSFRHTHASLLIEAGVHIKEIQERLGHSSITTTMDIYARVTKSVKKEASDQFSSLMKNISEDLK